jgi:UDP-glucuronate 4-epimerase
MKVLITGVAGFIGANTAEKLLNDGHKIVGVDSLSSYYATDLKQYRLESLLNYDKFSFLNFDLCDIKKLNETFSTFEPDLVIHLAAQPGVRLPIERLQPYVESNLVGFSNVAQAALIHRTCVFIYASSSSVYGDCETLPFREDEKGIKPKNFYGATKLANEIMIAALLKAQNVTTRAVGLRFFTVYGPKGRPDMAYFKMANSFKRMQPFNLYGDGSAVRDFTYIDDVSIAITKLISHAMALPEGSHEIFNIGGGHPRTMSDLIKIISDEFNGGGKVQIAEFNKIDMMRTVAGTEKLSNAISYVPSTKLEDGVAKFIDWFNSPGVIERLEKWV